MFCRKAAVFSLLLAAGLALVAGRAALDPAAAGAPPIYTGLEDGIAVGGYDPVSYFTEGKTVLGSEKITLVHEDVVWRFSTEANRDLFAANPSAYVPQYGGYCAFAVANGALAQGDPRVWTIVDGKLYLNLSTAVRSLWSRDREENIKKADANWPAVLSKE